MGPELIGFNMTYIDMVMDWYKNVTFTIFCITSVMYIGLICVKLIVKMYREYFELGK